MKAEILILIDSAEDLRTVFESLCECPIDLVTEVHLFEATQAHADQVMQQMANEMPVIKLKPLDIH